MKISFKVTTLAEEPNLEFSNDQMDNLNFVDMIIGDEEYTVSIDDMMEAMITFDAHRSRTLSRDKMYEE